MNFKNKNNTLIIRLLQVLLLFGFSPFWSCIDQNDYDLDRVKKVEAEPSFVLPIAYGNLGMQDLVHESDSISLKQYNDKLLYFFYEDVLPSTDIRDLYEIPAKSLIRSYSSAANLIVPANTTQEVFSKTEIIDFNLSPEQLSEILFKTGNFNFEVSTNIGADVNVKIEVPTYTKNEIKLQKLFTLSGASPKTSTGSENLVDYKANLSTLTPAYNRFPVTFTASVTTGNAPVSISSITSYVSFDIEFVNMDYKLITGFLGKDVVSIPEETVEIGAFGNTFKDANVSIKDAKLKFTVFNEYSVPIRVNFESLNATKDGSTNPMPLQIDPASPVTLKYPVNIGQSESTEIIVTNASEVFAYQPSKFSYKVTAQLNPEQTSGVNYVADTSKLKVVLTAEIPFYGKASGIVIADTFNISNLGEDIEEAEVMDAFLKAKISNKFPLEAKVQFYLTDLNYVVKDSLLSLEHSNLIVSGKVGQDGSVTEAGVYDEMIPLSKTKIDNLLDSDKLIVKIRMNTTRNSDGSQPDVKIKSDNTIDVNLGLKAHLKLSVKP